MDKEKHFFIQKMKTTLTAKKMPDKTKTLKKKSQELKVKTQFNELLNVPNNWPEKN